MAVLIVEDNALIAMTIEAALADAGYVVIGRASTAARALDIASTTPPRAALVNIQLNDGSSGVALARALKEKWATAVVFVTGEPADSQEHRDVAIGCLTKPCTDEALVAAVKIAYQTGAGGPVDGTGLPQGLKIF